MKKEDDAYRKVLHLLEKHKGFSMNSICVACGIEWGKHYGLNCPTGETRFVHFTEAKLINPNIKFKLRKLPNEKTLSHRS